MTRVLWCLVVVLVAVDVLMLGERQRLQSELRTLEDACAVAKLKTGYASEEEKLLTGRGVVSSLPRLHPEGKAEDAVQFVLLASAEDCTNAIEDEVTKLNQIAKKPSARVVGVAGFFVDTDHPERARSVLQHLSPPPAFPVTVTNALAYIPGATSPLVLVVRSLDGRILDAHKPIPQDLSKRDAFYARWGAALGLI